MSGIQSPGSGLYVVWTADSNMWDTAQACSGVKVPLLLKEA